MNNNSKSKFLFSGSQSRTRRNEAREVREEAEGAMGSTIQFHNVFSSTIGSSSSASASSSSPSSSSPSTSSRSRTVATRRNNNLNSYNNNNNNNNNNNEEEELDNDFDPSLLPLPASSTKEATQRIYRELRIIVHKQDTPANDLGFFVKLDKLQSVYQWVVQIKDFDPNIPLAQDMAKHKVKCIDLEVRFAPDYPKLPPYIRVIRPRLLRFMYGGGGHVTAGGSVCMDLLTLGNSHERGWSAEYTMEAVLLQVKLALSSLDPPARLDKNWKSDYSPREAMDAYIRVARQHGWGIPPHWASMFRN